MEAVSEASSILVLKTQVFGAISQNDSLTFYVNSIFLINKKSLFFILEKKAPNFW